jgi:hypothetical protein
MFMVDTFQFVLTVLLFGGCGKKEEVSGKFARCILSLQEFDFDIRHVKGVEKCA